MNNHFRKYKILLVHNFYQLPGGEDTVFRNEKKLLEDNGHEVVTYTRDNSELKGNILKKLLLPLVTIFNPKTYFDIKKIINEQDIDIVHVHNILCLISPAVFYAAINMKKPVIQTLHNFRMQCANGLFYRDGHICEDCVNGELICALKHKCYRNSFLQTLAIVLMLKIHRFTGIYRKVNFICLTEFNRNKLLLINNKKKLVDENRVFVKPNFVFEREFDSKLNNEIINEIHRQKSKEYYLFVGRLDEIKGIDIVLEAFSKMPNRELHVVGSGGEEYISEYRRFKNINFYGQLNHDSVLNKIVNAKALIYPTKLYEGQPISIIESYMMGVPVITSGIGNSKVLVNDNYTGLCFNSNDINSLITTIEKYENANMYKLKQNAKNEYISKYNSLVAYNNLFSIFDLIYKL